MTLLPAHLMELAYLVAVALFVLALKWLSSPATAPRGGRPQRATDALRNGVAGVADILAAHRPV